MSISTAQLMSKSSYFPVIKKHEIGTETTLSTIVRVKNESDGKWYKILVANSFDEKYNVEWLPGKAMVDHLYTDVVGNAYSAMHFWCGFDAKDIDGNPVCFLDECQLDEKERLLSLQTTKI